MEIKCDLCGKKVLVDASIAEGQHVKCPFCQGKFSYHPKADVISEDDLRFALAESRKDPENDGFYSHAPAGARLFIALVFYGKVFKDRLDVDQYMKAFAEVGPSLEEADLRYLLDFEEDASMRAYLVDRLRALGVSIDGESRKTRSVHKPKEGLIRENPAARSARAEEPVAEAPAPAVPPTAEPVAVPTARALSLQMVTVIACALLAIVIVAVIVVKSSSGRRMVDAEPRVERTERQESAVPVESPKVAPAVNVEKQARDEAVERQRKLHIDFVAYLERERRLLEETMRESSAAYNEIVRDQLELSKALANIERENLRRDERARTNGWIRYEKPEVVMMVLKDKRINELAMKYVGEDFSALCNECRGRIRSEMQLQAEHERLLGENRAKYQKAIRGLDDDVEQKNARARTLRNEANRMFAKRIGDLKARLSNRESMLAKFGANPIRTKSVESEMTVMESEIAGLRNEIAKMEEIAASGVASSAHITATEAENEARRKGDTALGARQDDDNAVQVKMDNIRGLFTIAVTFEERSLDRIRSAMQSRRDLMSVRLADAKSRLEVVHNATVNSDMLSAEQLDDLKRKIGAKIGEKVLGEGK